MTQSAPQADTPAVELNGVRFAYRGGRAVLDIPELRVARGERVFVHGPSGSGKTTLLGLLAGVLPPTEGAVRVLGTTLGGLSGAARDRFRAEHVGYVFQMFNLIPYLTVRENIALPTRLSARRRARLGSETAEAATARLATSLELAALLDTSVTELSVGQQQRVAVARALIGAPELIICDEPTSALDADLRDRFLELLLGTVGTQHATLVFVSHDRPLASRFSRTIALPSVNRAATMGAV